MSQIETLVKTILESTLNELNLNEYRTKGATGLKFMSPEQRAAHDAERDAVYQSKLTGNAVGRPSKGYGADTVDADTEETWTADNLAQSMNTRNNEIEDSVNGILLGYKKLLDLKKDLANTISAEKIPNTQQYKSAIENIKSRSNALLAYPKYPYVSILEQLTTFKNNGVNCKRKEAQQQLDNAVAKGNYLDEAKARIRALWEKLKNNELSYDDIKDVHEVEQYIDPESLELGIQ